MRSIEFETASRFVVGHARFRLAESFFPLQIVRRLKDRSTLKKAIKRPRFKNMSYDWQFAGWGS